MFKPKVLGLNNIPVINNKRGAENLSFFENKITKLPIASIIKKSINI
jgi:hypothetical protein